MSIEQHSRELFAQSVDSVDMRIRSRLTQARHAALDAARVAERRPWFLRPGVWTPAAGVTAALLLGASLWLAAPSAHHVVASADAAPALEDLDIVAASDEGSGDPLEMLQNDLDFYSFADKAASAGPTA